VAHWRRRPSNRIQRARVAEKVPALAHKRRRHAERVVVDPELAQTLQGLGLLHVRRQLDLRVAGVDTTEEGSARDDFVVEQFQAVHHVCATALGCDGLAAGGFVLGGDGADLRGHFVHGGFEDELAPGIGEEGLGDARLGLGNGLWVDLWVGLGNGNVMLWRRCHSPWLVEPRWGIGCGKNPIRWPRGARGDPDPRRLRCSAFIPGVAERLAIGTISWMAAFGISMTTVLALQACYDMAGNVFRCVT
jgi:hypothetical protein